MLLVGLLRHIWTSTLTFVFDASVIRTIRELVAREGLGIVFRICDPRPQRAPALS